jgi:hypothetical protein
MISALGLIRGLCLRGYNDRVEEAGMDQIRRQWPWRAVYALSASIWAASFTICPNLVSWAYGAPIDLWQRLLGVWPIILLGYIVFFFLLPLPRRPDLHNPWFLTTIAVAMLAFYAMVGTGLYYDLVPEVQLRARLTLGLLITGELFISIYVMDRLGESYQAAHP